MNAEAPTAPKVPREKRHEVIRFCLRMLGLPYRGAVVRGWDHFCAPEVGGCGFSRVFWGKFFYFSSEGGCAKVVPDAHRAGSGAGAARSGDLGRRAFGGRVIW